MEANCFICSLGEREVSMARSRESVRTSHWWTVGGLGKEAVRPMFAKYERSQLVVVGSIFPYTNE